MKNLYILFILFLTILNESNAQFSGAYSTSKWTTSLTTGSNGTINTASAPASVLINGSDASAGNNINTDYTIMAIASGIWSFHWVYHTNDADPSYDYAGITINGSFIKLSNDVGPNDQSGNYTAAYVTAGTIIGFRVQSTDDVGGTATLTVSSFSPPGGVLPVKLNSFTAIEKNSKVQLQWNVGEEINTAGYEVQHSVDAIHFTTVTTVASKQLLNYTITDNNPANGINYYRLKISDNDGSIAYSQIVPVRINNSSRFSIYPNPLHDKATIDMVSTRAMQETISIYNASGHVMHIQKISLLEGANIIPLDLSSFRNGVYFIRFEKSGSVNTIIKK